MKSILHGGILMNSKFVNNWSDTSEMLKKQHMMAMTIPQACIELVQWTFSLKQLNINPVVFVPVRFLSADSREFDKTTRFR